MIDYLAIGHLVVDRLSAGPTPGGSVAYACATAVRLGLTAAIVTVAGEELAWERLLPGVRLARIPSTASTSFENLYVDGRRRQRILAVAGEIAPEAVPSQWLAAPVVHLAPVAREVDGVLPTLFRGSLIGLTPQGLLRWWGPDGTVRQGRWAGDDRLLSADVVILSDEDVAGDPGFLSRCLETVPITLLTRGALGATLFVRGTDPAHFPGFPIRREVDPTGAGDVFAAAFLIEYRRTRDPHRAAAFACCAASFAVEARGLDGIPDREMVESRLEEYGRLLGQRGRHAPSGW